MVYKSLIYFDDAENDLNPKVIESIKWIDVKKRIEIEVQDAGIIRNYKADNSKFKQVFKWKPQRTLREAVKELWRKS